MSHKHLNIDVPIPKIIIEIKTKLKNVFQFFMLDDDLYVTISNFFFYDIK